MAVKPIPEGFHSVTPYLVVNEADKLISFLQKAFGAKEVLRHEGPGGKIAHAEVRVGDSMIMLGQANERAQAYSATLYHYVPDVDATFKQAVQAGGKPLMEPTDMFYGDRNGAVTDPCGNSWWIGTHKEDVSAEEVARRSKAYMAKK